MYGDQVLKLNVVKQWTLTIYIHFVQFDIVQFIVSCIGDFKRMLCAHG
jgi:hypothetical protein